MKKISYLRMFVISLLGFALTFSSNIQDPPLMTFKVRQLAPDLPNTTLGILGFIGLLVAMAVQPIIGVFSDRAKTKLGRRLPYIIGGAVLIAASLFLLAAAPTLWVLLLGVIMIQFSSNILQGPWQALIPDLVPEGQRGKASSLKAVMDILALVVGGLVAGMILGENGIARWGDNAVYVAAAAPTAVFFLFVVITAIWAREKEGETSEAVASRSIGEALKNAFYVNFRERPVFGWWFANRILFWGAFIAINSFLINYLIDVIDMTEAEAQGFYGMLKVILGGALILLALVSGWLSDRFGRKPVVLISGLVAFAGAFLLLFVRDRTMITVAGAIVGMGVGTFLTASWALATDIVPREEAARYLGIANIATCIGSGMARLLGGVLIDPINRALGSSSSGYLLLYGLAALFFLVSALVVIPLPKNQ
ncbi:MAG: MFS transporter [Anaerolineales bacterium]|nr:MFS transporter [Anaerolineales bacterium]